MTQERKEPGYLQDVVVPKETEQAPEGFDIDKEFGEGVAERMKRKAAEVLPSVFEREIRVEPITSYKILFNRDAPGVTEEMKEGIIEMCQRGLNASRSFATTTSGLRYSASVILGQRFVSPDIDEGQQEEWLRESIVNALSENDETSGYRAAELAAKYRVLFGPAFWNTKEQELMEAALKQRFHVLPSNEQITFYQMRVIEQYRLLRAHDIRFGKNGMEIIDTPPQPYQQKPIPPMPEERKF